MPFYGTVLGKQKITLCFASYPSRVGNWGVPQFALPIAWRSWQTVCQNIPWPWALRFLITWSERVAFNASSLGAEPGLYLPHQHERQKNMQILRKWWQTGRRIWFSSESKIKDCFLNQRRWTCWFCLCCLSRYAMEAFFKCSSFIWFLSLLNILM